MLGVPESDFPDHRNLPVAQCGYEAVVLQEIDRMRREFRCEASSFSAREKLRKAFPEMDRRFWDDKI